MEEGKREGLPTWSQWWWDQTRAVRELGGMECEVRREGRVRAVVEEMYGEVKLMDHLKSRM